MYVKQSVTKPDGPVGRSLLARDEFGLIDVEDLKVMPQADDKGVVVTDDIILKAGTYPLSVYLTPGTAEVTESSEGDPDEEGFKPQVKFKHPGNSREIREFKHNCINRRFIGFLRYCDGSVDLFGSPCNPIRMQTSYTGNSSGNSNEITFAQTYKGDGIRIYEGTVPAQEEKTYSINEGVVDLGSNASGSQYVMGKTDVVTALSAGKAGDVITLKGSSDSSSASVVKARSVTVPDSNILLKGGDVTLTSGSQVTLKAFDTGNGLVWIEQSRYSL